MTHRSSCGFLIKSESINGCENVNVVLCISPRHSCMYHLLSSRAYLLFIITSSVPVWRSEFFYILFNIWTCISYHKLYIAITSLFKHSTLTRSSFTLSLPRKTDPKARNIYFERQGNKRLNSLQNMIISECLNSTAKLSGGTNTSYRSDPLSH